MSEQMRVWKAEEDGCVQWWVVAHTEVEARKLLREIEVPSDDTEEMTVEPLDDGATFTLTCVDDDWEGPLPDGAVVTERRPATPENNGWPSVTATNGAWARLFKNPCYLAGSEW